MTRLEKVMEGLKCCIEQATSEDGYCNKKCPYYESSARLTCWIRILKDALGLLEEQQKLQQTTVFIDKEKLLEEIKNRKDFIRIMSDPVCIVEDAPVFNVPVLNRGRWINSTTCSQCGWQMIDDVLQSPNYVAFNYCPNCGAKMDEEVDNDED